MSRQIDFDKPLSEDEVQYLKDRDDSRWETAKKKTSAPKKD